MYASVIHPVRDFADEQTNAMGVTSTSWGPEVQIEALKFWFYSISLSIVLGLHQILSPIVVSPTKVRGSAATSSNLSSSTQIYKQLLIDGCDILIPGSSAGWIKAGPRAVGIASVVSSLVAAHGIWMRGDRRPKTSHTSRTCSEVKVR